MRSTLSVDGIRRSTPQTLRRRAPIRNRVALMVFMLSIAVAVLLAYPRMNRAQVARLYPSSCLGTAASASHAEGTPSEDGVSTEESAVISSGQELFCGGFAGEIPADTSATKATLHIAWDMVEVQVESGEESDDVEAPEAAATTTPAEANAVASTTPPESSEETDPVENTEESPSEESAGETAWFGVRFAHAEEIAMATVEYTFDGQTWIALGSPDDGGGEEAVFDVPIDDWSDLSNTQIRITGAGSADTIVDAMWIEVEYEDVAEDDDEGDESDESGSADDGADSEFASTTEQQVTGGSDVGDVLGASIPQLVSSLSLSIDDEGSAKINPASLQFIPPDGAGPLEFYNLPDACMSALDDIKRNILTYPYCGEPVGFSVASPEDYHWIPEPGVRVLVGFCTFEGLDCGEHPEAFEIIFISEKLSELSASGSLISEGIAEATSTATSTVTATDDAAPDISS